jgi:hypothetical protein
MIKLRELNFQAIRKMTMANRLKAMKAISSSPLTYTMFSALTPTQFAELFPRYWREAKPDIDGFMKALPSKLTAAQQQAREAQLAQTASGSAAGSNFDSRGYVKQYRENMRRERSAHVGGGYVKPPPQLTPEQQHAFDILVAGDNPVDSGIMQHTFGKLTDDQLRSLGISKVAGADGKMMFHYSRPELTDEQATSRLKEGGSGGGSFGTRAAPFVNRLQSDLGITKAQASGIIGSLGAETSGLRAVNEERPVVANSRGGFGWAQWTGPRRDQFESFAAARGLSIYSDEANYQFLVHELKTTENRALQQLKQTSTVEDAARTFTGSEATRSGFLRPRIEHYGPSVSYAQKAFGGSSEKPQGDNGQYSQAQIEKAKEAYARETNQMRQQKLATFLEGQGVSVGAVMKSGDTFTTSDGFVVPKNSSLYEPGNAQECATLGKAFNPAIDRASGWKVSRNDSAIQPGVVVATQMYNTGPSRHAGGFHTGVALSAPDKDGNFQILNQSAGSKPSITTVNVNNYNYNGKHPEIQGNYWGIINGHTERSREALQFALTARGAENYREQIQNSINQMDKTGGGTAQPDVAALQSSGVPPQKIELKVDNNDPNGDNATKVTSNGQPVEQQKRGVGPSVNTPDPNAEQIKMNPGKLNDSTPKVTATPNKYQVDRAGLIAAIKATPQFKNHPLSWMASEQQILDGFANDAEVKAAGVHYDAATGKLTMDNPNDPRVKQVMSAMNTRSFMTPIEEKKKEEAKKAESKKVEDAKPETKAAKPVPTASKGGDFNVGAQDIIAKPIGELNGDNTVVAKRNGDPLFTMKSNENLSVKDGVASVRPKNKEANVGPLPPQEPMIDMTAESNDVPGLKTGPSTGAPDAPTAQYKPNELAQVVAEASKFIAHNETMFRAVARINFADVGSPIHGHYTYGDQNLS